MSKVDIPFGCMQPQGASERTAAASVFALQLNAAV